MMHARLIALPVIVLAMSSIVLAMPTVPTAFAQEVCFNENQETIPCVQAPTGTGEVPTRAQNAGQGVDADLSKIFGPVMGTIMSLFAWLMAAAGVLLNISAYHTVIQMGDYVNGLSAVGEVWSVMRDIGNIILIFGFLAIGITTILGVKWYGGGTKMLPMLLVAAVFLNFSLFITEAIIDVGNVFATQFYAQINGGELSTSQQLGNIGGDSGILSIQHEGISNTIMQSIGLQTLYNINGGKEIGLSNWDSKTMFTGFFGIILFTIAAFVMFSLAFVLITRFVILLFLIIVAPIGFAGLAVPKLSGVATMWWNKLFQQTLTAPILLLMLYIALKVITSQQFFAGFGGGERGVAQAAFRDVLSNPTTATVANFGNILLSFIVAMGLLMACVIFAKQLSAFGASWATRMGGRLSFGAISLAGRGTLGLGASALLTNKRMQSWAEGTGAGALVARQLVRAGRATGARTFDARNMSLVKTGFGALGVQAGEGAKLTGQQMFDNRLGYKQYQEARRKEQEGFVAARREMAFKDSQKSMREAEEAYQQGSITAAERDALIEPHERVVARELNSMSSKQIVELQGIKDGVATLARNLSPEKFEDVMKSDQLTDVQKTRLREGRFRSLNDAIASGNREEVRRWSVKDLSVASSDILRDPARTDKFVSLMSDDQFDTLVKNDKLTRAEQQQLRNYSSSGRIANFIEFVRGRPSNATLIPAGMTPAGAEVEVRGRVAVMSEKKVAKLPVSVLTDRTVAETYTPRNLAAIMAEGKLNPTEVGRITTLIRSPAHPHFAAIDQYLNPATNPVAAAYWR